MFIERERKKEKEREKEEEKIEKEEAREREKERDRERGRERGRERKKERERERERERAFLDKREDAGARPRWKTETGSAPPPAKSERQYAASATLPSATDVEIPAEAAILPAREQARGKYNAHRQSTSWHARRTRVHESVPKHILSLPRHAAKAAPKRSSSQRRLDGRSMSASTMERILASTS